MVDKVTTVTEYRIDDVAENLYCNGETVAVNGRYEDDGASMSVEKVRTGIEAIRAGAETVTFRDGQQILFNGKRLDGGTAIYIDFGNTRRATNIDVDPKHNDYVTSSGVDDLIDAATEA